MARKIVRVVVFFSLIVLNATPGFALNIVFNDVTTGGMAAQALTGFNEAALLFESRFFDPITVRVDIDFRDLGSPTILGQASSQRGVRSYASIRTALSGDLSSTNDASAVANLQLGPDLDFFTTDLSGTRVLDNSNGNNNNFLAVNRANAKAIGLLSDDGLKDANITFNSAFAFDFDRNNGINPSQFDFVGVAAHEIGHALGFASGVDSVDCNTGPTAPCGLTNLDPFAVFSVLDLYRYSAPGVADLSVGGAPYLSIDGGVTNLGLFSTGRYDGDGRQASHFKDNLGLGIMDPTFAQGELGLITALDITAFDVMGYNVAPVPIPSAVLLFGSGLVGLAFLHRRKKA